MKVKELISQLQIQNPDDEIFIHQYEDYHISTNIKIQKVFIDEPDCEELACFTEYEDDIFAKKVVLLSVKDFYEH